MAKVRVWESGGGPDDDSQGGQKPGRQAPMSMTSRVGRNQTVGNVLDYQVYSSPIAYISNEESAPSKGVGPAQSLLEPRLYFHLNFLRVVPLV